MFTYIGGSFMLKQKQGVFRALAAIVNPGVLVISQSPPPPPPSKQAAAPQANQPAQTVANSRSQQTAPAPALVLPTRPPGLIGLYVSTSPDDPAARPTIDQVASLGANVVYNYASFHAPPDTVRSYLDYAQSRGVKVIFSLKDLYDQLGSDSVSQFSQWYGGSNEEIALNVVRNFKDHPATWGFAITDEAPESPSEVGAWQPTLRDRYLKIKSITTKPVMAVLVGHTSSSASSRRSFLSSLRNTTDTFALDYYPVPFMSQEKISEIAGDLPAVGDSNGWFVEQAFNWQSYSSTAAGLGFNVGAARYPTASEMINMARYALGGGARNILFYSLFDIKSSPNQLSALRAAIAAVK